MKWETFHTFGEETVYGEDAAPVVVKDTLADTGAACCAPA